MLPKTYKFSLFLKTKMDPMLEPYYVDRDIRENQEELRAQNQRISTLKNTYTEAQLELQMMIRKV